MPQEITNVLLQLAQRLGTTVDRLWPEMVRYTFVDTLGWMVFQIILIAAGCIIAKKLWTNAPRYGDDKAVLYLAAVLLVGLLVIFPAMCLPGDIATLVNPEAATVYHLLGK